MNYQAVLFDMDGTLLNTLPDLAYIANTTMREAGFPEHSEDEVRWFIGNGVELLFKRSLPKDVNLSEEDYQALYAKMRANYMKYQNTRTVVYDGVPEMLKALHDMNVKTGIVTNKMDAAAKEAAAHYFGDLIDVVVGARDDLKLKPYPDQGLEALRQLNIDPSLCIYVGDSDTDLETGANLGMPVLACDWGFRGEAFLKEAGAMHVIRKPQEIVDFVKYTEVLQITDFSHFLQSSVTEED